jgi:hypothetical protein
VTRESSGRFEGDAEDVALAFEMLADPASAAEGVRIQKRRSADNPTHAKAMFDLAGAYDMLGLRKRSR